MGRPLFSILIILCLLFFHTHVLSAEENFLLVSGDTNQIVVEIGPHINERVTPACSFNIALSLMGYDAGILKDKNTPIWDFQEGYDDFLESWKAAQTPQSWMTRSCVWYSKIIGSQLGLETIQNYLALLEYGNQDMSAGLTINPAWISSSLAISPREQVDFIQKMIHGKFSISNCAIQMTKALLLKEELSEGWKLYGKSGLGTTYRKDDDLSLKVRWFVGWIEDDHACFPFAYLITGKEIDIGQTIPRVKQLLVESQVMSDT